MCMVNTAAFARQSEQHAWPYPVFLTTPLFVRLIWIDDELSLVLVYFGAFVLSQQKLQLGLNSF